MAFMIPLRSNVAQIVQDLDSDTYKCRRLVNLTRKMTLGLHSTYNEIRATKAFSSFGSFKNGSTFPTNEFGHLLVGGSMPILLQRYRLSEIIAHGTFSQIFRAFDTFHLLSVAIKVMRIGYNALGMKEYEFLQLMKAKTLRGCQICK